MVLVEELDKKSSGQCYKGADSNSSIIIIERKYLKTTIVWHEAIHAHMNNIPDRALKEWSDLGKRLPYLGNDWLNEPVQYPNMGVICAYGRKNEYEDIATWGEAIYSKLNGITSPLDQKFDSDNPIYKKILAWFRQWEFISQAQYDTLYSQLFP
jgi:hypothetical protein